MLAGVPILAAACACAIAASWLMWWATKRSPLWAMAAGALLGVVALACAAVIAWLLTRAVYGD